MTFPDLAGLAREARPEDARKVDEAKLALAGGVVSARRLDPGETGR